MLVVDFMTFYWQKSYGDFVPSEAYISRSRSLNGKFLGHVVLRDTNSFNPALNAKQTVT